MGRIEPRGTKGKVDFTDHVTDGRKLLFGSGSTYSFAKKVTLLEPKAGEKAGVLRKNSVRRYAASFSRPYSWCKPPSTGVALTR